MQKSSNMNQRSHIHFFSNNLRKYIDRNIYRVDSSKHVFNVLEILNSKNYQKWESLPFSYLTPLETLGVGLYLAAKDNGHKLSKDSYFLKAAHYFLWTIENSHTRKYEFCLASTCLGVILLERSLFENRHKQKKYILLAKHYLETSQELLLKKQMNPHQTILIEINFIYQALVRVCLGELEQAIQNIQKAAKISKNPSPLWKILSNVYKNLGQENIHLYFWNKYEKSQNLKVNLEANLQEERL